MPFLECFDVSKSFQLNGQPLPVLANISFSVERDEVIVLVGQSGCGKSTLLRILAGLLKPDTGQVILDGQPMLGPSPDLSILFQNYTIFPWMTVLGNVEAGLLHSGQAHDRKRIALEYLELVGLSEFAKALPMTLSGGMQQRVALARTYAMNPKVLLMDEPFGALDALTRRDMQQELLRINSEEHKTVVFVTHDIDEAILLASRILVLSIRPAGIVEVFERNTFPDRAVLHQKIATTLDSVVASRRSQTS
jgi:NitT/TauT family transport system ATP-binding protein